VKVCSAAVELAMVEIERLPEGRPAGGLRAKVLPHPSDAEKVPLEERVKVSVELTPAGLPAKSDEGTVTVADQPLVVASVSLVFGGEQEGEGEALPARLVTVPGGRGVSPGLWSGSAAETGAIGTRNRKLGRSKKGIRAAAACFFVIPASEGRVFSLYNELCQGRVKEERFCETIAGPSASSYGAGIPAKGPKCWSTE
jgi:hypothetical protein